jgi:hypothetical protein
MECGKRVVHLDIDLTLRATLHASCCHSVASPHRYIATAASSSSSAAAAAAAGQLLPLLPLLLLLLVGGQPLCDLGRKLRLGRRHRPRIT